MNVLSSSWGVDVTKKPTTYFPVLMLRQVNANTKFLGRQKAKLLTWPPEKHTTLLSLTLFDRGQSRPELKLPETEAIPGPSRDRWFTVSSLLSPLPLRSTVLWLVFSTPGIILSWTGRVDNPTQWPYSLWLLVSVQQLADFRFFFFFSLHFFSL